MPTLTLSSSWNAFDPATGVAISPSTFKNQWLWGIPTVSGNGDTLSDSIVKSKLLQAQAFAENFLGVKLFKQVINETQDFVNENFFNWGYIKVNWPINTPLALTGNFNDQQIIQYPVEWLTCSKNKNSECNLYIVPNGQNGNVNVNYLAVSMSQYFGFHNARIIPDYWHITYCSGFDTIPADVIRLIGLLAVIDVLILIELGVGVLGGGINANSTSFGAASTSLSLDGLSQSISKMNGGNIFQMRIKQHYEELRTLLQQLKYSYGGIKFDVC